LQQRDPPALFADRAKTLPPDGPRRQAACASASIALIRLNKVGEADPALDAGSRAATAGRAAPESCWRETVRAAAPKASTARSSRSGSGLT